MMIGIPMLMVYYYVFGGISMHPERTLPPPRPETLVKIENDVIRREREKKLRMTRLKQMFEEYARRKRALKFKIDDIYEKKEILMEERSQIRDQNEANFTEDIRAVEELYREILVIFDDMLEAENRLQYYKGLKKGGRTDVTLEIERLQTVVDEIYGRYEEKLAVHNDELDKIENPPEYFVQMEKLRKEANRVFDDMLELENKSSYMNGTMRAATRR